MKIVDVAEFYADRGGGVRTYINQKLAHGAAAGHEVVVVAPGPRDGEEERHGGRVVWIAGPPMPLDPRYYVLWNEKAVRAALDRERPDVVEGSSPWSGGWFAARWPGEAAKSFIFHADPVAVYPQTFFGGLIGPERVDRLFGWYWGYLRRLSAHFDTTVVAGQWLADKLARFGVSNPVAVPFGIDKEHFGPHLRDEAVRAELLARCGAPADAALLVNVSRFHPEKRLGTLLEAFARVRTRRPAGLVIFGDGPLRPWVARRAASIPGVHLAGFTSSRAELATALASCDVMIHGSAAETYGLVVAEGLCSGLPLVVPRVGGAHDLAAADYAESYRPGDAPGCAVAIERLLHRDREALRAAVARAAAERVGTMADHFAQLFGHYQALVDGVG